MDHLPQEPSLDLPILTGEELYEAAMAKKSTAGWSWMTGLGMRLKLFLYLGLLDLP